MDDDLAALWPFFDVDVCAQGLFELSLQRCQLGRQGFLDLGLGLFGLQQLSYQAFRLAYTLKLRLMI